MGICGEQARSLCECQGIPIVNMCPKDPLKVSSSLSCPVLQLPQVYNLLSGILFRDCTWSVFSDPPWLFMSFFAPL